MKNIILTILRCGYSTTKKYKAKDLCHYLFILKYLIEDCDYGIRLKHNAFWEATNNHNRDKLITLLHRMSRNKPTDMAYFDIINTFANGDKFGIECKGEC